MGDSQLQFLGKRCANYKTKKQIRATGAAQKWSAARDVHFRAFAANPQKTVNFSPKGPAFFALRYTQQQTLRELQAKADSETRRQLSRPQQKSKDAASSLPNGAAFFDSRQKKKLQSPLRWSVFRRAVTTCFHLSNAPRFHWISFSCSKKIYRETTPKKSTSLASPQNPS